MDVWGRRTPCPPHLLTNKFSKGKKQMLSCFLAIKVKKKKKKNVTLYENLKFNFFFFAAFKIIWWQFYRRKKVTE